MTIISRIALVIFLGVVAAHAVSAQVELSPTRVILSLRERSQEVNLTNPTSERVEVTTDLGFRLLQSDSLGRVTLRSDASSDELRKSCRNWVKIFPHRFTLAPGESRSVRVLILPPDSIPDGEYWGRAVFGSSPVSVESSVLGDSAAQIETRLTMKIELDIPIIFRKGNTETGISIDAVAMRGDAKGTLALIDLRRSGNSAYRGTLSAHVRNVEGKDIATATDQFTTEFSLRKSLRFPKLALGSYTIEIESATVKKGAANDAVITAPTMRRKYFVTVSASGIALSPGD
ncbi:MAG: hypothetical protein JWQ98_1983 [Chlorobi bacterium]|nr:hypothetical protein [Chlorobiota bacterium]